MTNDNEANTAEATPAPPPVDMDRVMRAFKRCARAIENLPQVERRRVIDTLDALFPRDLVEPR